MLTKSGAKLLDFGLAKASEPAIAGSSLSMLPTTPPMTAQGTILGTLAVHGTGAARRQRG